MISQRRSQGVDPSEMSSSLAQPISPACGDYPLSLAQDHDEASQEIRVLQITAASIVALGAGNRQIPLFVRAANRRRNQVLDREIREDEIPQAPDAPTITASPDTLPMADLESGLGHIPSLVTIVSSV